jgi:hypothetical protein
LSALVVGTLSPDFEYLLRLAPRGWISHNLVGLFTFCLPLGLFVWLVFASVVRPALVSLLPPGLASALQVADHRFSGRTVTVAAVAVLLGAATHILWDGFTHPTGWAVTGFPVLSRAVPGTDLPVYKLAQHGSTLLGGAVVFVWIAGWLRRQPAEACRFSSSQLRRTLAISGILLVVAALAGLANGLAGLKDGLANGLGFAAVGVMIGLALGLLGFGIAHQLRQATGLTNQ